MPIKRRALLIGINYPTSTHALTDSHIYVDKFKKFLIERMQLPATNITTLIDIGDTDENSHVIPTRHNIEFHLKRIVDKTKDQDHLIIYFCGQASLTQAERHPVLLPMDYQKKGFITADYVRNIITTNLAMTSHCFLLIDSCNYSFNSQLPYVYKIKMINLSKSNDSKILTVDQNGNCAEPTGFLKQECHNSKVTNQQIMQLNCESINLNDNSLLLYGLLTDIFIKRVSDQAFTTWPILLLQIQADFWQYNIKNQIPVINTISGDVSIINQRIKNYI